jgi:hypothetical protein
MVTGWTAERSEFESFYGQGFSPLHIVQTCIVAHPVSYPNGNGGSFLGGVKRLGREAEHSLQTGADLNNVDLYTHSPIRLHGVVPNYLITGTILSYFTAFYISTDSSLTNTRYILYDTLL